MTVRNATGDTGLPEGEGTPPMNIRPSQKLGEGGVTGHAAIGAQTVTGTNCLTQRATIQSRTTSVVARADTAGLLRGATKDGPW